MSPRPFAHHATGAWSVLLLGEIDCLCDGAQTKLLRFLQDKSFARSDLMQCPDDVRVIATSNGRIGDLAAKGSFRRDRHFRLNVLSVTLPPLRERQEDALYGMFCLPTARALPDHPPAPPRSQ
jgi:transcriptional regulator with PAS, ATPase and Fis domain